MKKQKGNLIVISGASGVGKSTVIAKVLENRGEALYFSISCTTRKERPGEIDGVNYHFITREDFEARIQEGEFLEYAQYVDNYYGTSEKMIEEKLEQGLDVLLDIEVQGAAQVKEKRPDATLIFIVPPSFAELERRLVARNTDDAEKIAGRLKRAREEYREVSRYDYIVINNQVEAAAEEVQAILTASRCRTEKRIHQLEGV